MNVSTTNSWVPGANQPGIDFPLANLPLCAYRGTHDTTPFRIGVGIGDWIFDIARSIDLGLLPGLTPDLANACAASRLNALFALGRPEMRRLRAALTAALREDAPSRTEAGRCLTRQADACFAVPAEVGDYTDFLTSYNHAYNVGKLMGRDAVQPNFKSLPIAYHGRSSSIVISGEAVLRPSGQFRTQREGAEPVLVFGPSQRLDIEMELGAFIARGNPLGTAIALAEADEHIAGLCLLNDWSARDIQAWESLPLGPFQGKNFLTSVSARVITPDALEPYRNRGAQRAPDDPPVLEYLRYAGNNALNTFEIHVEIRLRTARMREEGLPEETISNAEFSRDNYWTFGQMIAHHTANGCNLRPGDLLGSGTISGPDCGTEGCLLELTRGGKEPLRLSNGETRTFLQDGDEVALSAFCERAGLPRIGFGVCRGLIQAQS